MTVNHWKTNKTQPSMAQLVEIARLPQVDIKDLLEVDFDAEKIITSSIDTSAEIG